MGIYFPFFMFFAVFLRENRCFMSEYIYNLAEMWYNHLKIHQNRKAVVK